MVTGEVEQDRGRSEGASCMRTKEERATGQTQGTSVVLWDWPAG